MLLLWYHRLVRSPEIGEVVAAAVGSFDGVPQAATSLSAATLDRCAPARHSDHAGNEV